MLLHTVTIHISNNFICSAVTLCLIYSRKQRRCRAALLKSPIITPPFPYFLPARVSTGFVLSNMPLQTKGPIQNNCDRFSVEDGTRASFSHRTGEVRQHLRKTVDDGEQTCPHRSWCTAVLPRHIPGNTIYKLLSWLLRSMKEISHYLSNMLSKKNGLSLHHHRTEQRIWQCQPRALSLKNLWGERATFQDGRRDFALPRTPPAAKENLWRSPKWWSFQTSPLPSLPFKAKALGETKITFFYFSF